MWIAVVFVFTLRNFASSAVKRMLSVFMQSLRGRGQTVECSHVLFGTSAALATAEIC